jgi:hypothetical protein
MTFAPFPISIELSRNMVAFPNDRLDAWYVEATNAISEWEESLDTLEEILLAGEFEKLNHFPLLAEESLKLLVRVQELRDQLLSEANALGLPASSLTRLVDFLGSKVELANSEAFKTAFIAVMRECWPLGPICDFVTKR